MKKSNSIKRDIIYQIVYRGLTICTPLITSPYISRILGVQNMGIFSATYAHANYFILLAMLGVEYHGSRCLAIQNSKEKLKTNFWGIYYVQLVAMSVSLLLYFTTIVFISPERQSYAFFQGIWVLAEGININWYFFGTQQFKLTVTRNIIIKFINILCVFIFVQNSDDLIIYILVMSLGTLCGHSIMWIFLFQQIGVKRVIMKEIVPHIKPILKLFIPVIALSVFQITDKSMIDLLSDKVNSGCYYNADRLMNIPLGIITATSTVMLPRLAKAFHIGVSQNIICMLKKTSELTISLACAIGFGIGAISFEFVPLFFGSGYSMCVILILGLVPAMIMKALEEYIRTQYLIPTGHDNLYICAAFSAAIINIIINYFFIIKYGALGAVLGTIIAEFLILIIQMLGVRKEISFFQLFLSNIVYIVFGIIMFIIIRLAMHFTEFSNLISVVISIVLGIIVYGTLSILNALLNKESIYHAYTKKVWEILFLHIS